MTIPPTAPQSNPPQLGPQISPYRVPHDAPRPAALTGPVAWDHVGGWLPLPAESDPAAAHRAALAQLAPALGAAAALPTATPLERAVAHLAALLAP